MSYPRVGPVDQIRRNRAPMLVDSSGGDCKRGKKYQPNVSLSAANATVVRFRPIVTMSSDSSRVNRTVRSGADVSLGHSNGHGKLQFAAPAEGVLVVLFLDHGVKREEVDRELVFDQSFQRRGGLWIFGAGRIEESQGPNVRKDSAGNTGLRCGALTRQKGFDVLIEHGRLGKHEPSELGLFRRLARRAALWIVRTHDGAHLEGRIETGLHAAGLLTDLIQLPLHDHVAKC